MPFTVPLLNRASASAYVAHVLGSLQDAGCPFFASTGTFVGLPSRTMLRQATQRARIFSSSGTAEKMMWGGFIRCYPPLRAWASDQRRAQTVSGNRQAPIGADRANAF